MIVGLSKEEVEYFNSLPTSQKKVRVFQLNRCGWTLRDIADSVNVPKSTIHYWMKTALKDTPKPEKKVERPSKEKTKKYKRPTRPIVPVEDHEKLFSLSRNARKFRSRMPEDSFFAEENKEFTRKCVQLYKSGIRISEIAKSSQVSYRNVSRRIKNYGES